MSTALLQRGDMALIQLSLCSHAGAKAEPRKGRASQKAEPHRVTVAAGWVGGGGLARKTAAAVLTIFE